MGRLKHLAYSDYSADVHGNLALKYFIDGIGHPKIQKALRMVDIKNLKSTRVYAMKFEAKTCSSRKDCIK